MFTRILDKILFFLAMIYMIIITYIAIVMNGSSWYGFTIWAILVVMPFFSGFIIATNIKNKN